MTNTPSFDTAAQTIQPGYVRVDAEVANNVRRHSQLVGVLRWALPIGCLIIIGIFLYSSGILHDFFIEKPEAVQPVVAENSVEMVQPRMSGVDKNKRPYEITAKSAKQDVSDPTKVTLENIVANLVLNEKDGKVSIVAKFGLLDTQSNFLQLKQDIIVTSNNGFTAYLTSADARLKEKYITSSDPVLIEWQDGSISANGLEITDGGNVIRFLKRVKLILRRQPGTKEVKQ